MWNPVEILNYNTRLVPCNNNNNTMNGWTKYCFTCDKLHYLDCILSDSIYHNTLNTSSLLFEYGLRESTRIAFYIGVPRYIGIGSDPICMLPMYKETKHPY